ncbi:MAG: PQQ-binding-like beta-propeller repeat protein [Acidobacteriota bacterium]
MKYLLLLSLCAGLASAAYAQNWPSFRGPQASGVADGMNPPVTWDVEKSTNVLWKTPIPGLAHSSPVVWGDRIFVTTAISSDANLQFEHGLTETANAAKDASKHSWRVYCLDKNTGRILWEKTASEGAPKVSRHVKASHANSTPATNGKYLVALFGSEGLFCYDLDGKLLWRQDLGVLDGGWTPAKGLYWGFGSSPVIYKNMVIVQCDTQSQSFLAAFNLADGKPVWRTPREEDTSWSTPTVYESGKQAELVASGTKFFRGYDPLTGKEMWRLTDGTDVKIPTPVAANGLYFLGGGSAHDKLNFYAVRAGAKGELKSVASSSTPNVGIQNDGLAWQSTAIKPHVVTPIVYQDFLYVCTDSGILTQFNAKTGEAGFRGRLGRGTAFNASPVAADGKLYFASEDGDVFVVKAGATFELLARNPVGEVMMATPAITDKMLILRGQHHVFGIKESASK